MNIRLLTVASVVVLAVTTGWMAKCDGADLALENIEAKDLLRIDAAAAARRLSVFDFETGEGTLPKISRMQYGVWDPGNRMRGSITYLQGYPGNGRCTYPVFGGTNLTPRVLGGPVAE